MVQNSSCRIVAEESSVLRCETYGRFVTTLMWIAGGLMTIGGVGTLIISMGAGVGIGVSILPAIVPIALGVFLFMRAHRRQQELGAFRFDAEGYVQDLGTGHIWKFEEVKKVGLSVDLTDGMRIDLFPSPVHWLMVQFKDGQRIRIGKGGREELQPVLAWLADAGLPVAPAKA